MKQGKRSVTEYWNKVRLVASEAEVDNSTGGELLLGGMITDIPNAWGAGSEKSENLEDLAQWAIWKETKLTTVRHIQGSPSTKNLQRETTTPRKPDGTYRPTNNGNQNYGEPIELDATCKGLRFTISREEFQRRIREQLCLQCVQPGHLPRNCQKKDVSKPFNAQARSWQPAKKTAPWQTGPKIRGIEGEQEPRTVGKRRMSPVRDGLRNRPERKPIILENYDVALNYTETLEHDNDHIMVKIQLHGGKESVTINAMIDLGATEDFIDREVCNNHGIKMIQTKNPKEIYLADGKPSAMGPVTHMTKVPMDISSHRQLATFQVAKLQNHEVILGMPWLGEHNPTIDWHDKRITFNSEQCTTWCLKGFPVAYAIPEEKALEENLITRFSRIQARNGPTAKSDPKANYQSVRVEKLSNKARVLRKGSAEAGGHDLYANEGTNVPARGQAIVGTGIAIGLPHDTYGRIAPRSSLAVKHRLMTNAGVIDSDYRGEVKVVLANLGDQPYPVERGDQIAKLIIEKIVHRELQEVTRLDNTERGEQGFRSSNTTMAQEVKGRKAKPKIEINEIWAKAFGQFYRRGETTGILRWDEVYNEIQLEAINISTELAIKNKKNNEEQDVRDTVPQEYHHRLDVFEKGEKTTIPPHPPGIDLGIDLE